MNERAKITLGELLEELKEDLPNLKKGMVFETITTFFDESADKNIIIEDQKFTKPLACSKKDKEKYLKEDSPISKFHRETKRGDFLRVVKINKGIALCENLSLKDTIKEKYYKDLINITYNDVIFGKVKIYRRNTDKFF